LLCFALLPVPLVAQEPPHWTYKGETGPKDWSRLESDYATCGVGRTQSPINIKDAKTMDLPALHFAYQPVPLNIIDNGHSVQVNYPAGSTLSVGDKSYTLKQFHFHHPSEEHVNGHKYDMVAHLVHADAEGHLAVVAIFMKKGHDNPFIGTLWKNLPSVKEQAVELDGTIINAKDLLPANQGYYTFAGSLTTPPCSEGVTWYVMKEPVEISGEELASFAKLYPMDARPIQATNGRNILQSK
jgi:carbonic anhydrase